MGIVERRTLKKLAEAARYWHGVDKPAAQPIRLDEGVAEGLRFFGASEDDIRREQEAELENLPRPDFEVHEDCWESWLFFMKVQRQWRYVPVSAGMGVTAERCGLNWTGIESVIRLRRVTEDKWDALLDDLLVIEDAVMKADRDSQQG